MEIIYRADDGTTFENKDECKKYENHLNKMINEIHMYDKNLKKISMNDFDWKENIHFFQCETDESFDFLFESFPYTIVYEEDFEKTQIFFEEKKYDFFMTTKNYEKSFDTSYLMAKKLEKGE